MTFRDDQSELLTNISQSLDIPDHAYEDAVVKYLDIATFLGEEKSELAKYNPDLYVQGSFSLGTVVQPIGREGEYDVDLVCQLEIAKERTSQKDLKKLVGDRLKIRKNLTVEESRRCWTLVFQKKTEVGFHMDVLPSIPNTDSTPSGILLTDKELRNWQKSNPKKYIFWFKERMKKQLDFKKQAMLSESVTSIEDIPDWKVKTTLQQSVQFLKRHRDIYFEGKQFKPVTMIITTLAAKSYLGENDLITAIKSIVDNIESYIEKRENGEWWVENPAEPDENFADKWNEYEERRLAFFEWINQLKKDVFGLFTADGMEKTGTILENAVGKDLFTVSYNKYRGKEPHYPLTVPILGDMSHAKKPDWHMIPTETAKISCMVYKSKNGNKLWPYSSKGSVGKDLWIKFSIRTKNISEPYDVHWQVINTGDDAFENGELRGGIFVSQEINKHVNWERTKFRGTHLVKGFIVKDSTCVATGQIEIKIR